MGSTPDRDALEAADAIQRLRCVWRGQQPFAESLEEQLALREAIADGHDTDTLIVVEHPPTLTLGRRATRADILWDEATLARAGMAVCETPRGGETTLHAPGQLVCYPIVRVGRRIRQHIIDMAETTIELVTELGVCGAEFRMEHPGVWIGPRKLASIGIHVRRGIAVQGLSMNVTTPPKLFGALISCGLEDVVMTTVADEIGADPPPLPDLATRWARAFARRTGRTLEWVGSIDGG